MSIERLPKPVFSSILSNSSIYSQTSVLKELVENSIDSLGDVTNAQVIIEIDSQTAGLNYLKVQDNGSGVSKEGRTLMCLNCTTSKLSSVSELDSGIDTFGFRGEGLYYVSQLAEKLQITTKTDEDTLCDNWYVNKQGLPTSVPRKFAGPKGTSIQVEGLFSATPVRRKFLEKHSNSAFQRMKRMILGYALLYRNIRFQLKGLTKSFNGKYQPNGDTIILPSKIASLALFSNVLKLRTKNSMFEFNLEFEESSNHSTVKLHGVFPKMRAQDEAASKKSLKILAVNGRLLNLKLKFGRLMSKGIGSVYEENMLLKPHAWFLDITFPLDKVDVNIEPSKDDIMVPNEQVLIIDIMDHLSKKIKEVCNVDEEMLDSLTIPSNDSFSIKVINPVVSTADKAHSSPAPYTPVPVHTSSLKEFSIPSSSHSLTQSSFPKRIPSIKEMSQRTLGLQRKVTFSLHIGKSRKKHMLDESRWINRKDVPSSSIKVGLIELAKRVTGKNIPIESLVITRLATGIYRISVPS